MDGLKSGSYKKVFVGVIWLATILIPSTFLYQKYQHDEFLINNPSELAKVDQQNVTAKVGKFVELPTGETPSLATVTDLSKFSNQSFFTKAQVGDRVIIYSQAKLAVLYRPSTDKIIEIASVAGG
jgi:hypothetical protein